MDSLSRTSLLPQTISFPLSAFAPDHRSPPASDWMLSCFQSSHFFSRPPPRSICPSVSFVWLSPASMRFPSLPGCTRCLSSIPAPHRSWSILGPIPLSCAIPPLGFTPVVAVRCAHTVRICVPRSHISSAPNTFLPPHRSLPNHSIRPGRALVHPSCFPRISHALHLSAV